MATLTPTELGMPEISPGVFEAQGNFPGGFRVPPGQTVIVTGVCHIEAHTITLPDGVTQAQQCGNVIVEGLLRIPPNSGWLAFHGCDPNLFVGGHTEVPLATDPGVWVIGAGRLDWDDGDSRPRWTKGIDPSWQTSPRPEDTFELSPTVPGDIKGFTSITADGPVPILADGEPAVVTRTSGDLKVQGEPDAHTHVIILNNVPVEHTLRGRMEHVGVFVPGGTGVMGRYGLHFHKIGWNNNGTVVDMIVNDWANHGFVSHGSHGITFDGCVVYNLRAENQSKWAGNSGFFWDHGPNNASHRIRYLGCMVGKAFRNHSTVQATGFDLTAGDGNEIIECMVVGMGGQAQPSYGNGFLQPKPFAWGETTSGVWRSENLRAQNVSAAPIFGWQNTPANHVVNGAFAVGCWSGVDLGAYQNIYQVGNLVLLGPGSTFTWPDMRFGFTAGIVAHANSITPAYRLDGYGVVYADGPVNVVSGFQYGIEVPKHNAAISNVPGLFRNIQFSDVLKVVIYHETSNDGVNGSLIDLVDCTNEGNPITVDDVDLSGMAADSVLRVQNGATAWQVGIDGIPVTIEPFYDTSIPPMPLPDAVSKIPEPQDPPPAGTTYLDPQVVAVSEAVDSPTVQLNSVPAAGNILMAVYNGAPFTRVDFSADGFTLVEEDVAASTIEIWIKVANGDESTVSFEEVDQELDSGFRVAVYELSGVDPNNPVGFSMSTNASLTGLNDAPSTELTLATPLLSQPRGWVYAVAQNNGSEPFSISDWLVPGGLEFEPIQNSLPGGLNVTAGTKQVFGGEQQQFVIDTLLTDQQAAMVFLNATPILPTVSDPVQPSFILEILSDLPGEMHVRLTDTSGGSVFSVTAIFDTDTAVTGSIDAPDPQTGFAPGGSVDHVFRTPGVKSISLFVTGTEAGDEGTAGPQNVTVQDPPSDVTAAFDWAVSAVDPLAIEFTNLSQSIDPLTYSWDFGDGSPPSSELNPVHTYAQEGSYTVTLTASSSFASSSVTKVVATATVTTAPPTLSVSLSPSNSVIQGEIVNGSVTWTDPDQVGVDEASLVHEVIDSDGVATQVGTGLTGNGFSTSIEGTYTYLVAGLDNEGRQISASQTFLVSADVTPPAVTIDVLPPSGGAPHQVTLDVFADSADVGSGDVDWGDGNIEPLTALSGMQHTYTEPGAFTVRVTVRDQFGNANSASAPVTVSDVTAPIVSWSITPLTGGAPLTVTLSASVPSDVASGSVDWGDGTAPEPLAGTIQHVYNTEGSFTITLRAADAAGNEFVDTKAVQASDVTGPAISLVVSPGDGLAPLEVFADIFLDSDAINPFIDWGDGQFQDAVNGRMSHTYQASGFFIITLTAEDLVGNQSRAESSVSVFEPPDTTPPALTAFASPLSGEVPLTVELTVEAGPDTVSGLVQWGDGETFEITGPLTTTLQHVYATAGAFLLTVSVQDADGNIASEEFTIQAGQDVTPPSLDWTVAPLSGETPLEVQLTATIPADVVAGTVDWGDGSAPQALQSVMTHTYQAPDTYLVRVIAQDAAGNVFSDNLQVFAQDTVGPVISGSVTPQTGEAPVTVVATVNLPPDVASGQVLWGDGQSSDIFDILEHTYQSAGTYSVLAQAQDAAGNSTLVTLGAVIVSPPPVQIQVVVADDQIDLQDTTVSGQIEIVPVNNTGEEVDTVTYRLDGQVVGATGPNETFVIDVSSLTEGVHELSVTLTTTAGNVVQSTANFVAANQLAASLGLGVMVVGVGAVLALTLRGRRK